MAYSTPVFDKPWLIVCEGGSDKAFLLELIRAHGLPEFNVYFPHRLNDDTGGWTKFGRFLKNIQVQEDFRKNTRAILVMADNDDDPARRFAEIQDQVSIGGFNVPAAELACAKTPGLPPIVILMVPLNRAPGTL